VDVSTAYFSAACNFGASATQVGPWSCYISCPSSRNFRQSCNVGRFLDMWTDPPISRHRPPEVDTVAWIREFW
jgi:hypothetical protein